MKTYNAEQVKAMFNKEAVLLGTSDMVPERRVICLFGNAAAEHARRLGKLGEYFNGYGNGSFTADAFTYRGFQAAASYYNVSAIQKEVEGSS
ncbi:MAG: hypothetical protein J6L72_08715 [Butyricicoccus sp.]|nr:hypothetical protein [Butyricicoccus sp.]